MWIVRGCIVLMWWIGGPSVALATVCDCRPEFETDAEASGVCSKIKDDKKWCKLKFGSGAVQPGGERHEEFARVLKSQALPQFDVTMALSQVAQPPEEWTVATVRDHLSAMFTVALWDTAPERLKPVLSIIRDASEQLLVAAKGDGKSFKAGSYEVDAAKGCVQLIDGTFAVMLRTPFARPLAPSIRSEPSCAR